MHVFIFIVLAITFVLCRKRFTRLLAWIGCRWIWCQLTSMRAVSSTLCLNCTLNVRLTPTAPRSVLEALSSRLPPRPDPPFSTPRHNITLMCPKLRPRHILLPVVRPSTRPCRLTLRQCLRWNWLSRRSTTTTSTMNARVWSESARATVSPQRAAVTVNWNASNSCRHRPTDCERQC